MFCLSYVHEEKTSTSGIKAAIKNKKYYAKYQIDASRLKIFFGLGNAPQNKQIFEGMPLLFK